MGLPQGMRQSHFLSVVINACHCEPVWCSAQRIKILMTASGSHTLIYATLMWQSVFLLVCTEIGIVIANQWCSAQRIKILMTASGSHTLIYATLVRNPPVFLGATYHACHCEPVLTLAWQSVTPAFPWGKVARASPASARRMRASSSSAIDMARIKSA